ncbi:tyrosine-type recombinase/integrase [Ammoniphilus sp. CFH 90114]|uniref:tyrosine-type recombinase/integrase n=1 Tax=Ammoniphilus sp. CFH 90114 TaxID=2493665 RepID=UPI00100E35FD|nr:tyrosine-type recombinase/integrase [Ammoniphilus sp. CFH 90114]RXT14908.1 recombinase XerC [Ammoniphilus sp. CFH 90114]
MKFEKFIEKLQHEGKSELTLRQYRSSWNRFVKWFDGEDAEQATQLDIARFKRTMLENLSPSTVKQTLLHVRAFFSYLTEQGDAPDNPVENVDAVTVARTTPKWLNKNEQNAVIRAIRRYGDIKELTIFTLLLHTGLRVQELCDVKLTDITLTDRKGNLVVRKGKHNRRREVPLNVDSRRVLEQYLSSRNSESEYLFDSQRSPQMTTRAVQHIIEKYRKLTGIENLTAHALRHSFCHELVSKKIPLDVVARLAGHMKANGTPNIEMTLVYTQPSHEDLERAVEELSWT